MTHSNRARSFLKLPLVIAMATAGLAAQQAIAHGYIESPKSRSFMCKTGEQNSLATNCGNAIHEPQSVEYNTQPDRTHYNGRACHGSFTSCGPADGNIAAGGLRVFSPLDQQTSSMWVKNTIKPGLNTFEWHYTARHATKNWQFFITKKDWNPNQPLTRDSFELTPLLTQEHGNQMPAAKDGDNSAHQINIPADRDGYHIVLATWMVGDNNNTFYQVVDLNIDNADAPQSAWNSIGAVQPEALSIGDKVKTRVFNNQGEQSSKQVVLSIDSAELAKANNWPKALAEKVNAAKLGYLMGELNAKDEVVPAFGKNSIFAKKGSDISSVLIDKELAGKPAELSVTGMQSEYTLKDGKVDLHFNAIAKNGDFTVTAKVINSKGETVAFKEAPAGNTPHFALPLSNVSAGQYDLVVIATSKKDTVQQTVSFTLKAEANVGDGGNEGGNEGGNGGESGAKYDYVFPDGLKSYKAGTVVLQPKNGKTYECKQGAVAGWCTIWTSGSNAYEPGVGFAWDSAWNAK